MPAFSAVAWICDPAGSETSEAPVRLLANPYPVFSKRSGNSRFSGEAAISPAERRWPLSALRLLIQRMVASSSRPCLWRKRGKLRPSVDVGVFPHMSANQGGGASTLPIAESRARESRARATLCLCRSGSTARRRSRGGQLRGRIPGHWNVAFAIARRVAPEVQKA